jgi:hypothetical protein
VTRATAPWLFAALFAAACATLPKPEALTIAEQQEALPATERAAQLAPQAFANAKQLRERAERAYEDGNRETAEIFAEHALAAFQHAVVQARLVRARQRIQQNEATLAQNEAALVRVTSMQQKTEAEAKALELRLRVVRDAEPREPIERSSPAREAARREAAISILEATRLLCLAARMLDPSREATQAITGELDALERRLRERETPTPIDRAMSLRGECLRALTLTRREARKASPERDPTDVLFVQLNNALPEEYPIRDDRGVVVSTTRVFTGHKHDIDEAGRALVSSLAQIATANPDFPLMVVVHTPGDATERMLALKKALAEAGHDRATFHAAGDRIPRTVQPIRGAPEPPVRVEFVLVSPE